MPVRQASADQPVDAVRQQVHRARRGRMPDHADAEHEQIAEPEGQAGDEADLGDVDRGQAVVGIDPEPDRAAGEHRGAEIVADHIGGEARQRGDAVRHVQLADRTQGKEIVERQSAERADHAQRGEADLARRLLGQRGEDDVVVDTLQGADQRRDRKADDQDARDDADPFPADISLEATPQRAQQSMHSSSRRGGNATGAPCKTAWHSAPDKLIRAIP